MSEDAEQAEQYDIEAQETNNRISFLDESLLHRAQNEGFDDEEAY